MELLLLAFRAKGCLVLKQQIMYVLGGNQCVGWAIHHLYPFPLLQGSAGQAFGHGK